MDNHPELNLSLTPSGDVQFVRGDRVSEILWSRAISWWADSHLQNMTEQAFEVPLGEFVVRMGWLRSNWTSQGGIVSVSDDLRQRLGGVREVQDRFQTLARGKLDPPDIDLSHLNLMRNLTPEQIVNIGRLVSMDNGANFSVPGAGKTSTQLVVWRFLRASGRVGRLLVICPRSAFEAWLTEPDMCFGEYVPRQILDNAPIDPDSDVLIVNYEQLEREDRKSRVKKWVGDNQALVVLDEAHRVKGGGASVRWRACRDVASVSARVDLLTGTPMPQSFEDLRNLLNLSWARLPRSFLTDSLLQSLTRGGVFVRTTKSELSLPTPQIIEEVINPGVLQEQIYSALIRAYFGTFQLPSADAAFMGRKGKAVMTLLAAATNPGLLLGLERDDAYLNLQWPPREIEASAHLMSIVATYARTEIPPKYEWVRRFLEIAANKGRKVLVWSTFVGNLHALERVLEPFSPAVIYGATSSENRIEQLNRFRHDSTCSVLLTNPQTLGEGISLHTTCHDAIYVDRSYNAGLYLQSLDRIHRLGLAPDEETRIYLLGTAGTIDQRVSVRLRAKVDRLARALDDSGLVRVSMPDDALSLDRDEVLGADDLDLDDLFAHLVIDESASQ
jgi:SNF2 family DNA or RNA helicase